jgi:lysine-specific demethylase 3
VVSNPSSRHFSFLSDNSKIDTCMTSLFSASYMCRVCGREVCHECFLQVKELTIESPSASQAELAALQGKREIHAHSNPFFLSCNKKTEHGVAAFTPVTRFWGDELKKAIEEMEDILESVGGGEDVENNEKNGRYGYDSNSSPLSSPPNSDPVDVGMTPVVYDSYRPSNLSSRVASIPVHKIQQIPASLFDPIISPLSSPSHFNYMSSSSSSASPTPSFSSLWALGVPILVKDVLPRFKLTWTPEYFIQQYGDQSCLVIECQTDTNKSLSVRQFFEQFGKYEGRTECWKLKVRFFFFLFFLPRLIVFV